MSGQKYKRTNFEDDDNTSGGGSPPGVIYDPAVAFKAGATFWQKRSLLEKFLLVVVLVFTMAIIVLGALVGVKHQEVTKMKETEKALCTSPACVTVASSIINSMDSSVDPCTDFYKYSCDGWIRTHPLPSGSSRWGTFGLMWKENQLVMKHALESNATKSEAENKAVQYYHSCMDKDKIMEKLGAAPMQEQLKQMGGWNISTASGPWNISIWNFQDVLQKIHGYGMSNFFNVYVAEDGKDSSQNIIQLDQSGLYLAREQYLTNESIYDNELLSAYLKYMTKVGVLLGGDHNVTEQQMYDVIEFEQTLANITVPDEQRRDDMKLYNKQDIKYLDKIAPFVDWVPYMNSLLEESQLTVTPDDKIVIFAADYLHQVSDLVTERLQTEQGINTIHNYMLWHLIQSLVAYLSKPFRDARKEFLQALSGVKGGEEKWRYCTTDTDSVLGFALGAMFVREAFHGDSRDKAEMMIQEIKAAFKNNLPNLKWMDDDTRGKAIDKANAVIDMIGFPEYILNATLLDKRYAELEVKPNEYFKNNLRNLKYVLKRNTDKLKKKPDKKSWSMSPPTVNAYYTPTKNEIVFPAGILQAPFYDKEYPKSLNFGAMGVVMGHELTHGFDDQGREYDKRGILRPWWNKDSVKRFKAQAQCMVDQYSKYTVNGQHVKGLKTLGENIADNGGLKAAYHAYLDWVKNNGEEPLLPGLKLTHKQLFFVAFAQVWCSTYTPEAEKLTILSDSHSPNKYRVIGTLSNSKEFAEQFKCQSDSPMNPKKKCEVW